MSDDRVHVIGAGMAGLACARGLAAAGLPVTVLEASDGVGGRVRTDAVDGFLLDRGFQVLLTADPQARALLDYQALGLRALRPGVLLRRSGRFLSVADPLRLPWDGLRGLLAPVGTPADKLRLARLRRRVLAHPAMPGGTVEVSGGTAGSPDVSAREALTAAGFSAEIVERLFAPLAGALMLDPSLGTSNRMLELVLGLHAGGDAALPAAGMGALAGQLAAGLPEGTVRLGQAATAVGERWVALAGGERRRAAAVVVATDGPGAARLLGDTRQVPGSVPAVCLYFAAEQPPVDAPLVVLDGDREGPANHVCVPSAAAPSYAPEGAYLVSATVVGEAARGDLEEAVLQQLADWFGSAVLGWRHLRTYRIDHALPAQPPGTLEPPQRPVRERPGVYVCGDHRDHATIGGALASGRRAAEAVIEDLD